MSRAAELCTWSRRLPAAPPPTQDLHCSPTSSTPSATPETRNFRHAMRPATEVRIIETRLQRTESKGPVCSHGSRSQRTTRLPPSVTILLESLTCANVCLASRVPPHPWEPLDPPRHTLFTPGDISMYDVPVVEVCQPSQNGPGSECGLEAKRVWNIELHIVCQHTS